MQLQVWHDEPAVKALGINIASAGFWLTSDMALNLPNSFSLVVNARVFGVQVGSVTVAPMRNGDVRMQLEGGLGTVLGRIDDWRALDATGKQVDRAKDPHWKTAASVAFTITALTDVTLSSASIAGVIPGLGFIAQAALGALGNQVKISLAHQQVVEALPHAGGAVAFKPPRAPELAATS